jgi:DNA-binding NarL/FixJ family response regulator
VSADDPPGSARVLVAEDNADVAEILQALLAPEPGLTCVGAVGGVHEVAEAVRRLEPRVLLLDLELKDGSGLQVLRECRRHYPDLVVIIISGHSAPALIREALAAGAADFLVKPDDMPVLADRVRAALSA